MTEPASEAKIVKTQILVAGAGSTGIAAAMAFARAGHKVALVGRFPPSLPGRTVALFEASTRFLDALGVLQRVKEKAAPIAAIRMVDDTTQLLPTPDLVLQAREIGLPALGVNISNDELVEILIAAARERADFEIIEADIANFAFDGDSAVALLADGRRVEADFVVAADGRASRARAVAGIDTQEWTYPQVALTALLTHERPHDGVSVEFHTRSGPFTLVPLQGREGAPNRSSLVWLMSVADASRRLAKPGKELQFELEDRSHGRYGAMAIEGGIGQFRMGGMRVSAYAKDRVALVGETCHVFPPIGAQGLNLSLRDVADLEECLASVDFANRRELGHALARYDRHRRADIGFRTLGVDLLNRSLIIPYLPVDLLRGAGFVAVSAFAPLRRALIREGVAPHLLLPRLMQEKTSRPRARRAG
ncbi:FAD-dependent monooxygenase [Methylocystis bryophila]|uniref:Ubiquinone biosynthesis protein UbiH n=1 Tax=Methylocystis bryophila TaxID=655015 RepID=A0A1W6MWL4_9HYPH|nr:FAD-dependent monooxygenase [Methylocystis bryophila]ARN81978.1 ubiquinone biosynthesis protein UbiH [Methylocystis bryophila]BDV38078.1 2-octaprenyl-6-methoxyphenyl hydroxylase [Methylocystis bryophila]